MKIGGISEEDKQRLEQLESSMNIVANENGLQKLASQLSTKISERYDIESEQSETQQDEQNSIKDRLEAYRGASDAEVQALKIGKISKAKRCQKRANMLIQQLEKDDIQRAVEYKRGVLAGLNVSLDISTEKVQVWLNRFKGCWREEDFNKRKTITQEITNITQTKTEEKSTKELFAKAKELTQKGVHTYILTGSYAYPSNTLTRSMEDDIVFIDSILGVKLALSDHRSSHVTEEELTRLASKIRTASLIAGKQANLTIHMGDEKQALDLVFNILEKADIPVSLFQPTHCTRNPHLFEEAKRFTDMGGTIDITCDGNGKTLSYIQQIKNTEKVTISSDAQGSWSTYNEDGSVKEIGITPISNLKKEFIYLKNELGYENALPFFTKNVANVLGFKHTGEVKEGFDCDLVIWKEDQIQKVITKK